MKPLKAGREVAIAGEQYHGVDLLRQLHNVNRNAHVPVALGGSVTALDVGFEFDAEADLLERILEFQLFVEAAMNGIGGCGNNLAFGADALPEFPVVELATIGLAGRVVDVLHIDKNSDGFHSGSCARNFPARRRKCKTGSLQPAPSGAGASNRRTSCG